MSERHVVDNRESLQKEGGKTGDYGQNTQLYSSMREERLESMGKTIKFFNVTFSDLFHYPLGLGLHDFPWLLKQVTTDLAS